MLDKHAIKSHRPTPRVITMPHELVAGDIRLILLPPGRCELHVKLEVNMFDVNLNTVRHKMAVNSDQMKVEDVPAETLQFGPSGTEYRVAVDNQLPGCILEMGDATMADWIERQDRDLKLGEHIPQYHRDRTAADLGRAAIRYTMQASGAGTSVDQLTVEALALGIAARGMAQLSSPDGNINAEINRWARKGRQAEIERAIDLLEARLTDSTLKIDELASAACLSSSQFSSIFKSMVGETPYSFILRRRAEFARDLIIGTRTPLAHIAHDAGFSSQAHMTVVIRRVFGTTPAAMRD
ncbi:helix-turn-helix transcriptional regulator [Nereida sp. MMG025]|uniref:helix-turn-helix transcriptional regulator n=1 Tax=Nereida sp. MMG025 TaxID=2909981 RepID=UPI001F3F643F|nr:AraC family transcriptional regulator [Nereida sp. MMG025]MCF6446037.1 AraC family transcriptional regulator [Nereida sp. MMG025]